MADTIISERAGASNIVRLPTAARRKVNNPTGKIARDYRINNPWPARSLRQAMSVEMVAFLAIIRALPPEQRRAAAEFVRVYSWSSEDELYRQMADILEGWSR
jgi:hypothetical protein